MNSGLSNEIVVCYSVVVWRFAHSPLTPLMAKPKPLWPLRTTISLILDGLKGERKKRRAFHVFDIILIRLTR